MDPQQKPGFVREQKAGEAFPRTTCSVQTSTIPYRGRKDLSMQCFAFSAAVGISNPSLCVKQSAFMPEVLVLNVALYYLSRSHMEPTKSVQP